MADVSGSRERRYVTVERFSAHEQPAPAIIQSGCVMSLDMKEIAVLIAAAALIGMVLWYFFGSRR